MRSGCRSETGERYRLPSESEWEYAARAGSTTRLQLGAGHRAQPCELRRVPRWVPRGTMTDRTAPVGSFEANAWGLHDVHGNVWEWVEDCWHENYARAPRDGSAWTTGGDCGRRVLRGGSWFYGNPRYLRSALSLRNDAGVPATRLRRVPGGEDARLGPASSVLYLFPGGWGAKAPSERRGCWPFPLRGSAP